MPKRFRLTRRFSAAMTEDGYRRLRRFARDTGLSEDEALSFVFENFDGITDAEGLTPRLRIFQGDLEAAQEMNRARVENSGRLRREYLEKEDDQDTRRNKHSVKSVVGRRLLLRSSALQPVPHLH